VSTKTTEAGSLKSGSQLDVKRPVDTPSTFVLQSAFVEESTVSKWLWISISIAFLIANVSPPLIKGTFKAILQLTIGGTAIGTSDRLEYIAEAMTSTVFIPLEELLFVLCLAVMAFPIVRCIVRFKEFWRALPIRRILSFSVLLFVVLSVLVLPYSYPGGLNSHVSGLSGLGPSFANMSRQPFQELDLLVTLFETKFLPEPTRGDTLFAKPFWRWLTYLSLMTSSFVLVDFQWPGYSDHLSYILMALIVLLPLSFQARIAVVSLAVLNHEGIALALIPFILLAFPRKEQLRSLSPLVIFYGMMIGAAGFNLFSWFQDQGAVLRNDESVWAVAVSEPGLYLSGLLFTYKLFWPLLAIFIALLWRKTDRITLLGLAAVSIFPIALTLVAWDTTRVAGFGWLGIVIVLGLFLKGSWGFSKACQYSVMALICVNLFIPTYNVLTFYRDSMDSYPYPGIYMFLDGVIRQIASSGTP
jgi:hypothetical protein